MFSVVISRSTSALSSCFTLENVTSVEYGLSTRFFSKVCVSFAISFPLSSSKYALIVNLLSFPFPVASDNVMFCIYFEETWQLLIGYAPDASPLNMSFMEISLLLSPYLTPTETSSCAGFHTMQSPLESCLILSALSFSVVHSTLSASPPLTLHPTFPISVR